MSKSKLCLIFHMAPSRPYILFVSTFHSTSISVPYTLLTRTSYGIGHSMGGLDARRLVHFPNLKYKVLSITTVSTPHYGSPIADWSNSLGEQRLLQVAGSWLKNSPWTFDLSGLASREASKLVLRLLFSGSGQAIDDMRPEKMAQFNEDFKNVEGIEYFSTTSEFKPLINHPF